MNKIIFPLKEEMGGPSVGDLQSALHSFLIEVSCQGRSYLTS